MSIVLDLTRTQAFAEKALGIVNGGFLSLMLSVGHRTGLLDTLATLDRRPRIGLPRRLVSTNVTCASGSARW